MTDERNPSLIGGFLKGLKVIESFDSDRQRQSIADISRATGFDRATCRRLLLTLVHAGYAEQDSKYFWLSPRMLRLAYAYLHSTSLPNILQKFLEQLSGEIHESCSASVLEANRVVYIARASYQRVMSINLHIGTVLPSYCSSMGRVLLSEFPPEEAARVLRETELVKRTTYTKTEIDDLMRELELVRQQDYAVVDQELEIGVRSIAVPIRNRRGQMLAAINIGTNAARVSLDKLVEDYLPHLRQLQADIAAVI